MSRRIAPLALAVAGGLLLGAAQTQAADEPLATAPIPPPPTAAAPAHKAPPQAHATDAKPPAKHARHREKARAEHKPDRRSPEKRAAAQTHERPKATTAAASKKARTAQPEHRPEPRQSLASREPPRSLPNYRPRRYYREEVVIGPESPPFPPPWYDRGPPFAYMPYPRAPVPPWEP